MKPRFATQRVHGDERQGVLKVYTLIVLFSENVFVKYLTQIFKYSENQQSFTHELMHNLQPIVPPCTHDLVLGILEDRIACEVECNLPSILKYFIQLMLINSFVFICLYKPSIRRAWGPLNALDFPH